MLITSIIFSKNRPLQLDLCLKSIKKNFKQSTKNIVICNNDEGFDDAYQTLKNEHTDVMFWNQSESLFHDINRMVRAAVNDYVCFFVDDCICFNKVDIPELILNELENSCCVSLRLGLNISERSHDNIAYPDRPVEYGIDPTGKYIYWNKTSHLYGSYWSYSHSVDGHIFNRPDMENVTSELWELSEFRSWKQTPNEFESAIQRFWPLSPQLILSPIESCVVNSPNNKVQESHNDNRSGDIFEYNEKTLLEKYESGGRIDLEDLDFSDIKCPHTEIDILKGLK